MTSRLRFASNLGLGVNEVKLLWAAMGLLSFAIFSGSALLAYRAIGEADASPVAEENPIPEPQVLWSSSQSLDELEAELTPAKPEKTLSEELSLMLRKFQQSHPEADFGIAIKAPDGSFTATLHADKQFNSASLYKPLAAYRIFQKIEAGVLNENSFASCIEKAITYSDNDCGKLLQSTADPYELDSLLSSWGMPNTSLSGYYPQTTALDQVTLYTAIYRGKRIDNNHKNILLTHLANQQIVDRLAEYPTGVKTYHKTGDVLGTVNSATIVEGKTPYVIIFLSDNWNLDLLSRYQEIRSLHQKVHTLIDDQAN